MSEWAGRALGCSSVIPPVCEASGADVDLDQLPPLPDPAEASSLIRLTKIGSFSVENIAPPPNGGFLGGLGERWGAGGGASFGGGCKEVQEETGSSASRPTATELGLKVRRSPSDRGERSDSSPWLLRSTSLAVAGDTVEGASRARSALPSPPWYRIDNCQATNDQELGVSGSLQLDLRKRSSDL
ncbi:unnamed protein product [Pleuronectes platessa]|uniref:Uncharacterized protein n=1 Tax=Pleuronectes platessa TaxID=8262 RepID=A0A9N7U750_PLEPL|nr:unnamed protein product [Pleuronectes platessa]